MNKMRDALATLLLVALVGFGTFFLVGGVEAEEAPEGFRFPPGTINLPQYHFFYMEQNELYSCSVLIPGIGGSPLEEAASSCAKVSTMRDQGTMDYNKILRMLGAKVPGETEL